jgi:hypothetical protein
MQLGRNKRQRELARMERQKEKDARREERKKAKAARPRTPDGVDPDIAHITPGPQPIPDWLVE